jgi:hypothetical protein
LVLIAGCRRGSPPPGSGGSISASEPVASAQAATAPATFRDVAPGDTAAVIDIMQRTMSDIDGALDQMQRRDTLVVPPPPDTVAQRVTLWSVDGVPRKLVVSDSNAFAGMVPDTSIWFLGGDVSVVQLPYDVLAFDAGNMLLWTDQALVPRTDVSTQQIMTAEGVIMNRAEQLLALFGVKLP